MTTDPRFAKLGARLRGDPYGLICRLYDFAASMQQDGDISQIDNDVLARRLEFKGTGARLRKMLTQAGYVDETGYIVGWHEKLFRLFTAVREQNRERGLKSAAKRAQSKAQFVYNQLEGNRTEEYIREEERTATVERSVERPVDIAAPAPTSIQWPNSLSQEQLSAIAKETHRTQDQIRDFYPEFRDTTRRFKTPCDENGWAEFRDKLRKKPFPAKSLSGVGTTNEPIPEPPWKWRDASKASGDFRAEYAERDWATIDRGSQTEILKLASEGGP